MQVNRMLIDVVYCRQFHNNSAYVIASSSAPIIEYAFIRCLVFVSLFKYKILFEFFSRQLSDLLSDSFFYVCSSIHTNVIPQNGFQRSQTKYGYTEAAFVICGTYVVWHFFHYFWFEYILLSDMEMIEKL